jgi:hypothetical protein
MWGLALGTLAVAQSIVGWHAGSIVMTNAVATPSLTCSGPTALHDAVGGQRLLKNSYLFTYCRGTLLLLLLCGALYVLDGDASAGARAFYHREICPQLLRFTRGGGRGFHFTH